MTALAEFTVSPRTEFIHRVADALEEVGVEYVILHGSVPEDEKDTDVDLAVSQESLPATHALIQAGTFGRLLQCLHYDVPWCSYYVVATGNPSRRYRQIDVACDPWGVGRYGLSTLAALRRASAETPRRPDLAAEALYLAVKGGQKQAHDNTDLAALRAAFAADPAGASALFEQVLGEAGRSLALALHSGECNPAADLESVARSLAWHRRPAHTLARMAVFSALRIANRLWHPTGLVVCLAGPDGTGKSTLAAELERAALGAFRRTARLHLRPGLLPPPARLVGRLPADGTNPHGPPPSRALGSLLRLLYLYADTLVGWIPRLALPKARTGLVLLERGWLDLAADPRRYRLSLPSSLVLAFARLLPQPDLTLVLEAPAAVVRERKPELELAEIERQRRAWRGLARGSDKFVFIDASLPGAFVLDQALEAIESRLAGRQRALEPAEFALRCLGAPAVAGERYAVVSVRGRPRFFLPARAGRPGPSGSGLYRAGRSRNALAATVSELAFRSGLGHLLPAIHADPDRGLGPEIARALGLGSVELAAAVPANGTRPGRTLLAVCRRGRPLAYAKVTRTDRTKLAHELGVLETLAAGGLRHVVVPRPLALVDWEDCTALLVEPLHSKGRTDRRLSTPELAALAELGHLGLTLAPRLGSKTGLVPVHGDFCGWNAAPADRRFLAVWDWEDSRLGLPMEDLFHWRMQRLLYFRRGSVDALVRSALEPDEQVRTLARALGVDPQLAATALEATLKSALARTGQSESATRLRLRALEFLVSAR